MSVWLEGLGRDVCLALRLLAKQPDFTAVAVFTLALAIGANATIFSVVNGLLLRPAVPSSTGEYVGVYVSSRDAARTFRPFSYAEYRALREPGDVFTDVAALSFSQVGVADTAGLRRSFAFLVSENFFALGGAMPVVGRFFSAAETQPNAAQHVVVAGYELWRRQGGRADFIGSTLRINGQPYTVIGVAPKNFSGVTAILAPELWLPLGVFGELTPAFGQARELRDLGRESTTALNLFARLRPGLTLAGAQSALRPLAWRLEAVAPAERRGTPELMLARPFSVSPTPNSSRPLTMVGTLTLAMSTLLMLIASLNLANMLLARGTARTTEFTVRVALGCTRARIVRQLMVEGLVLSLAGGMIGTLFSSSATSLIQHLLQSRVSSLGFVVTTQFQPDLRVLGFTLLGCVAATLVFSLGPAIRSTRIDLVRDLKAQPGPGGAPGHWGRLLSGTNLMVTAQATLSLVLIFVAGLFFRASLQSTAAPIGLQTQGTIVGELDFSLRPTSRDESLRRVLAAVEHLRTLPGMRAVGVGTLVPFANLSPVGRLAPAQSAEDASVKSSPRGVGGVLGAITPGFLDSLGVHVVRGRDFLATEAEGIGREAVCLIDERMAGKLFPGAEAVGQRVRLSDVPFGGEFEVVGVVSRHTQDVQDNQEPFPRIYVPLHLGFATTLFFTVRSSYPSPLGATRLVGLVRGELLARDPELPLMALRPFAEHRLDSFNVWQIQLGAWVFGLFGVLAAMMATVGIYGVKAYAVSLRTREIGIRMALGADRGRVFRLIMRQGLVQFGFAGAAGVLLALGAGRVVSSYLVGVHPADPLILGVALGCLALATTVACWLPARRATRVNPLVALRVE